MKVPWKIGRCIVCCREGPLCDEHLIPRALGGILTCSFLCRDCNSGFGKDVEAAAKSDPSILLAAKHLHEDIPELAQQLLESHPHVTIGPGPRVPGSVRNGEFRAKSRELDDGSLIRPTDETPGVITTMLKRKGYEETPIKRAVEVLEGMPESRPTTIAPGLEVINWPVEGVELDLSQSVPLNPILPAKIAFEFLALCVGKEIYADEGPLPALRRILMERQHPDDKILRVERLSSGKFRPFHGICIEDNSEYFQIQVRLFGWLAYHVHFPGLRVGGPRYVYTHWLNSGEDYVRTISTDSTPPAS